MVGVDAVDFSVTAGDDLPELYKRHSHFLKQTAVNLLEVFLEGDTTQSVTNIENLTQTYPEQCQAPQERIRGAGLRPCPKSGAEEAQTQEGEKIEESVKSAAPHEAKEQENIRQVKHGTLRVVFPPLTQRVHLR